jgi:hypothetical protein
VIRPWTEELHEALAGADRLEITNDIDSLFGIQLEIGEAGHDEPDGLNHPAIVPRSR